jgi:broad specificity phosphatase PhoE
MAAAAVTEPVVEFVFIRHAQATHNVAAEIRGDSAYEDPTFRDAELTDEGHLQVSRVRRERGAEFAGPSGALTPAVIYCSPLRRCRQTLVGVMPFVRDVAVRVDDRLMEPQSHVCNHRIEKSALVAVCPPTWSLECVSEVNPKDGGGDSIVKRIREWTAEVLAAHPGQRVLVVSHFTWIQNWFRIFKKELVAPANCGILCATLRATPHQKLD